MANTIWPFIPFVALRGAQIFFAIVVLGLSGYVGTEFNPAWSPWFTLVTALFTLIGAGFLLVTFFIAPAFTAPLITLCVDAFLFLFWLISLAGFADQASPILQTSVSCSSLYSGSNLCGAIKGNMAMIVFEFILFLATLVFSALWFHRERTGKTAGTKNPEGGFASAGAFSNAPQSQGAYPMTQQPPMPNPPPAQQPYVDSTPQPVAYPQEQQYQYPPQHQQQDQQYPSVPAPAAQTGYPHAQ